MSGRVVAVLAVGLMGCGFDAEEGRTAKSEASLVTFTVAVVPDGGWSGGPIVGAKQPGYVYAKKQAGATIQFLVGDAFMDELFVTEPFFESISAVSQGAASPYGCETVFVLKSTLNVGYSAQDYFGELGCRSSTSNFVAIPGQTASGTPVASSWYSGGVVRYDVFAPKSYSSDWRIVSTTGTGTDPKNPTWTAWSTDYQLLLKPGTSPAAVSVTPGRIDLVACDSSGTLNWRVFSGVWSAWQNIGVACASSPSVAGSWSKYGALLRVVALDASNNAFVTSLSSGTWSAANTLGGPFTSPPSIHRRSTGTYRVWTKNNLGQALFADL